VEVTLSKTEGVEMTWQVEIIFGTKKIRRSHITSKEEEISMTATGGCQKVNRLLLLLTKQLRRIYIKLEGPFPCTVEV
jgi:hypothetical protein